MKQAPSDDRLLDLKQCAERLGVSERTAYGMWQVGTVPTVYVGRLRRVRASDLAEYIASLQPA